MFFIMPMLSLKEHPINQILPETVAAEKIHEVTMNNAPLADSNGERVDKSDQSEEIWFVGERFGGVYVATC